MRFVLISTLLLSCLTYAGMGKETSNIDIETVKRLAEQGDADFIYELGYRYEQGIKGVTQDFQEAIKWHCKAAPKLKNSNSTTRSILRVEAIAESDPSILDPNKGVELYCDKKQIPKPSLDPYSPIKVSWCNPLDADRVKDCSWFKSRKDSYGQPLGASAVAEIALKDLPLMSLSTDWYLDQAWKFGLYGPSLSAYGWSQYQNNNILNDENQRPHYFLEIESKGLKKLTNGFAYTGVITNPQLQDKPLKLRLRVADNNLVECLQRGIKGHYKTNTLLFRETQQVDKKYGRVIAVKLVKTCFGNL